MNLLIVAYGELWNEDKNELKGYFCQLLFHILVINYR